MLINLKQYVINYFYKIKTKVNFVDNQFYDDDIFLIDLEEDDENV